MVKPSAAAISSWLLVGSEWEELTDTLSGSRTRTTAERRYALGHFPDDFPLKVLACSSLNLHEPSSDLATGASTPPFVSVRLRWS